MIGSGFRCLDRDACFCFDSAASVARLAHAASDCDCDGDVSHSSINYINRHGQCTRISVEQAEELMQCDYTPRLIFQRAQVLRNYAFWGFTPTAMGGFLRVAGRPQGVSSQVAVGHVVSLEDVERTALGLFATAPIADGTWIGEYTGVIQVEIATTESLHDAYGMCYPSVYEDGQLYLTASEMGNEIRCINHSARPNATFTPAIHDDGILHIDCFAIRSIAAGEQIVVDYGPTYWQRAGHDPLALS